MAAHWGSAQALAARLAAGAFSAAMALAPGAWAGEPTSQDKAAAEALFLQANALMAQGKTEAACGKWAASQQLDPAVGTLLFLGDCYEKLGRTASAWATFAEASSLADREGQTARKHIADLRAAALRPQLSSIVVTIAPDGSVPGLTVRRDGVELPPDSWGSPVPLDPGTHVLEAAAPAHVTWSKSIELRGNAASIPIVIPKLEPSASPSAGSASGAHTLPGSGPVPTGPELGSSPGGADGEAGPSPLLVSGLVIGGVGLVGLGLGTAFGLMAKSANDDSLAQCRTDTLCSADGLDSRQTAKDRATVSTAGFVAGGALTAAGIVMVVVALTGNSTAPSPSAAVTPVSGSWVGVGDVGLGWRGTW